MFKNLQKFQSHSVWEFIKWKLWDKTKEKRSWPKNMIAIDDSIVPVSRVDSDVHVTSVGHVSFLLQFNGLNVLTDPVWSMRASPLSFIGPKRIKKPGIQMSNLPKIDVILISHNHYDHLDIPTLKELHALHQPIIVAPLKNDEVIKRHIKDAKIVTLDWGQHYEMGNANIFLEPAQHWSARSLWDRNYALWGSFILDFESVNTGLRHQICFIGDSGYNQEMFRKISSKHSNILLSLTPIGAYKPAKLMKEVHMCPEEGVLTHIDLQARYSIPSHYDVFPLAGENYGDALKDLDMSIRTHDLDPEAFKPLEVGERHIFKV